MFGTAPAGFRPLGGAAGFTGPWRNHRFWNRFQEVWQPPLHTSTPCVSPLSSGGPRAHAAGRSGRGDVRRLRHAREQCFEGRSAHFIGGLPDDGQFRDAHLRLDGVVKTGHHDVFGDPDAGVGDLPDAACGHRIAAAEHGVRQRVQLEKILGEAAPRVEVELTLRQEKVLRRQSHLGQCLTKALFARPVRAGSLLPIIAKRQLPVSMRCRVTSKAACRSSMETPDTASESTQTWTKLSCSASASTSVSGVVGENMIRPSTEPLRSMSTSCCSRSRSPDVGAMRLKQLDEAGCVTESPESLADHGGVEVPIGEGQDAHGPVAAQVAGRRRGAGC